MIKNCSVLGIAGATVVVLGALSKHMLAKERIKSKENELVRLHDIGSKEIEKNGKMSDETNRQIRDINNSKW